MISIITSSYNKENFKCLEKNISETIGVPYELICINNPGKFGLCEAYNKGAALAKYDVLCFAHEDILFHTINWGTIALTVLHDASIGLLGVAGGTYKSKYISSGWCGGNLFVNVIQHKHGNRFHWQEPKGYAGKLADVLALDGLWLCMRKSVWKQCPFDENILQGFHFYDYDISLSVKSAGFRVCVTYEVLIEHFSAGKNDYSWFTEAKKIQKKWSNQLPWSLNSISEKERKRLDYEILLQRLHETSVYTGFTVYDKAKLICSLILLKPFALNTYRKIKNAIAK